MRWLGGDPALRTGGLSPQRGVGGPSGAEGGYRCPGTCQLHGSGDWVTPCVISHFAGSEGEEGGEEGQSSPSGVETHVRVWRPTPGTF